MSYILDAVRKAEAERREQQAPLVYSLQASTGLHSTPQSTEAPRWLLFLALSFILLNIGIWQYQSLREFLPSFVSASEIDNTASIVSTSPASTSTTVTPADQGINSDKLSRAKLWQASAAAQTAIGALDFSFHVYSADPKRRTIIINGQRMTEGTLISEVLRLDTITEKGVLIRHANMLVDVEILEQW